MDRQPDALATPRPRGALPRGVRIALWALLATLVVLALVAVIAWQTFAQKLQQRVLAALGPQASLASVDLAWPGIALRELRVAADPSWQRLGAPPGDALAIERVLVEADWRAALNGALVLTRVTLEQPQMTLLRSRDGALLGPPFLLPLFGNAPKQEDAQAKKLLGFSSLRLDQLRVDGGRAVLHDLRPRPGAPKAAPRSLRLEAIDAQIGPLAWPAETTPTRIEMQAQLGGAPGGKPAVQPGHVALRGNAVRATHDATLRLELRALDLPSLQAQIGPLGGGVERGTLDMDLDAHIQGKQLRAPGQLRIDKLQLASSGLGGLKREAVLAFLKRDERITLDIVIEGRLDDPKFSIEESLATRIAVGLADTIGAGIGGVVGGVGSLVRGLLGH